MYDISLIVGQFQGSPIPSASFELAEGQKIAQIMSTSISAFYISSWQIEKNALIHANLLVFSSCEIKTIHKAGKKASPEAFYCHIQLRRALTSCDAERCTAEEGPAMVEIYVDSTIIANHDQGT